MTSSRTIRCLGGGALFLAFALQAYADEPPTGVTYTQTPLAPSAIPQFVQPLLVLRGAAAAGIPAVIANGERLTLRSPEARYPYSGRIRLKARRAASRCTGSLARRPARASSPCAGGAGT